MKLNKIRIFRKILRKLERELNGHLKTNTACSGVSIPQCHTILGIEEQRSTTIGQLSKLQGLDKSTLSRTIDGLFNIGLVKRLPHQSDRRYLSIALTDQGKATCAKINRFNDEYFTRIFDMIPEEKHDLINECFDLIAGAMAKNRMTQNET